MANNVFGGRPNVIVSKTGVTASFVSAGITASNTSIIYKVGDSLQSYVPDRGINAITAFESEVGYWIVPITDMDLTAYCVPPITDALATEVIDWDQLQAATDGGNGDLISTGTVAGGGTATKKIGSTGSYVQMIIPTVENSTAAVLALSMDDDANYSWGNTAIATAYYDGSNLLTTSATLPTDLGPIAQGYYIRLERSGTDVLVRKSADGITFTTAHTHTGVITGADIFIKGILAAPFVGQTLKGAEGYGLVA